MTCIAAWLEVKTKTVWMAADSAGSNGHVTIPRKDQKLFYGKIGSEDFLLGFTGSFRMGDLLRYKLKAPERSPEQDIDTYLRTYFIDAVRQCFREGGFLQKKEDVEGTGASFLLGYEGRIFQIDPDLQVGESLLDIAAVGSGYEFALGALSASQWLGQESTTALHAALRAACTFCTTVREPITVLRLPK